MIRDPGHGWQFGRQAERQLVLCVLPLSGGTGLRVRRRHRPRRSAFSDGAVSFAHDGPNATAPSLAVQRLDPCHSSGPGRRCPGGVGLWTDTGGSWAARCVAGSYRSRSDGRLGSRDQWCVWSSERKAVRRPRQRSVSPRREPRPRRSIVGVDRSDAGATAIAVASAPEFSTVAAEGGRRPHAGAESPFGPSVACSTASGSPCWPAMPCRYAYGRPDTIARVEASRFRSLAG